MPLSGVIGFVRGWAEFIADLEPGSRAVVFPGPPAPFGVVICYEGIFPDLFRQFVNNGARVMVNMTNDGWFGPTSGPDSTSRCTRSAPWSTASPWCARPTPASRRSSRRAGQIIRHLSLFERGVLSDRVPLRQGQTLFTRLGDWVAWLSLVVSAASIGVAASEEPMLGELKRDVGELVVVWTSCGGIFDLPGKEKRLAALDTEMASPAFWDSEFEGVLIHAMYLLVGKNDKGQRSSSPRCSCCFYCSPA